MKRRERVRRATAVLMLCAMMLSVIVGVNPAKAETDPVKAYQEKLQAAKDLKEEYEKKKYEAEESIRKFKEEKLSIEKYIEELDMKLNDISMALFELQETIEKTEAELRITEQELERAREKEAEQYRVMSERVRYIYENGEVGYLDILFNAGSIADILNQSEYISQIQEYDNALLEHYEAAKLEREQHQAYLEASLLELAALKEQEELEGATVSEMVALKQKEIEGVCDEIGLADEYLFTYITEISNQEMSIAQIIKAEEERVAEEERKRKEEEERLAREAEERRKAAEKAAAEAAARAAAEEAKKYDSEAIKSIVLSEETDPYKMIWPLPGDHRTYSKFGYRKAPIAGASTYHKGWDIGGEYGAPIVAVLAGTVTSTAYNSSGGNVVTIDHGNGYSSVYCHCSKYCVSEGDHVQQGTIVALVGSTGVSTSPHLHFGIKVDGTYIDPNPYIGPLE